MAESPPCRLGIVGANGQVGAELCLLLARHPGIDLVPICRTRAGSALLRYCGIPCRHGRPADPDDAPRLLGDCDVVVNSALASGSPRQIRQVEDQITATAFTFSRPGATIIHFSTQNVYGDPTKGRRIRPLSPYGGTKLLTEKTVRKYEKQGNRKAWVLRLGHVGGELQSITTNVRREILNDDVVLPDRDTPSNLVYTVSIVDAILKIIAQRETPGIYDLMNSPPWSWRQVYEYEAGRCGVELRPTLVPIDQQDRAFSLGRIRHMITAAAAEMANSRMKDLSARIFAHLPNALNERALARLYHRRSSAEIAALASHRIPADHLNWVQNGRNFLESLTPTADLLRDDPYRGLLQTGRTRWPDDISDAKRL